MKDKIYILLITVIAAFMTCSCSQKPIDPSPTGTLPDIYPDYIGVTIPSSIAPLNFQVNTDSGTEAVYVIVKGEKTGEITGEGQWAKFDIDRWHELLQQNMGSSLTFTVYAKTEGKWLQYNDFKIDVSPYPLDEWGLTYRRIAPGYEVFSSMGIYQRDLSNFDESPIIENTQTSGQCYNCHTPNRTNPDQFVFHVRGQHGATMIQQEGDCTWLQAINDSIGGSLVYPYWHPTGRYCAFSTNQTRQGFHVAGKKRLEVFDLSSDILVYDVERKEIIVDTCISKKDWSENIPVFSPDGRSIYYTTCYQKEYPLEYTEEKYNLCRVDFDPETGRFGAEVDTIFDAVSMGKSVTWPRPSYDGRYILFTLLDYGYFSIWHDESEQWLLDTATGEAHPIDGLKAKGADSFHNWDTSSRWIVFTSRRDDGLYSRLYMAAIDDEGKASKPFMLPQYNPKEYYDASLYSFNTPDFTSRKVDFDANAAAKAVLSDKREATHVK